MATVLQQVVSALSKLGGEAPLRSIYAEIARIRPNLNADNKATIRHEIQTHSSDSVLFEHKADLFYWARGKGKGIWGLRSHATTTPESSDLNKPPPNQFVTTVTRIIRDTPLVRELKKLHKYQCQICGQRLDLPDGEGYCEGHHIQPLGKPHCGPDIRENIIILCPNHHALCDLCALPLSMKRLRNVDGHTIGQFYLDYHNELCNTCR